MLNHASKILSLLLIFVGFASTQADDFDGNKTVGLVPLTVQFKISSTNWCYYQLWDFGDGVIQKVKDPEHTFVNPGKYTIKVEYRNSDGQFEIIKKDFIVVYPPSGLAELKTVKSTETWQNEGWENASDGDTYGNDGVVSALTKDANAIFEFSDNQIKEIQMIRFFSDFGLGNTRNLVNKIKVEISTTGTENTDFAPLKEENVSLENWTEFDFDDIPAKYIKLSLLNPDLSLKQFSEFEVYTKVDLVDSSLSRIVASGPHIANGIERSEIVISLNDEDGTPITGKTVNDIYVHVSGNNNHLGNILEVKPGIYVLYLTTFTAEEKIVSAYVNGVRVAYSSFVDKIEAKTIFSAPENKNAQFRVVDSSKTWPSEGWSKAFDNVVEGKNSYVSATGNPPFVVVEFNEKNIQWINTLRIKTKANVVPEQRNHWVKKLRLFVSTSGLNEYDFALVLNQEIQGGEWEDFPFPAVAARYIKILIDKPGNEHWCQIAEMQMSVVAAPTPVELALFEAQVLTNAVKLNWVTMSESNNYGFEIQRREKESTDFNTVGFLAGHGTINEKNNYQFIDQDLTENQYTYRLKQIDFDGTFALSDEMKIQIVVVKNFNLSQNYPNPFNPQTNINYQVHKPGDVKIAIYNMLGQEVKKLVNQFHEVGQYRVAWDGTDFHGDAVSSGYYLYIIETKNYRATRRMSLVR